MMQALLQSALGESFLVESAGVRHETVGLPADPRAVACMAERGLDLSDHRSRWAGDLCAANYDYVVCVDAAIARRIREFLAAQAAEKIIVPNAELGGIPEPSEGGLETYRSCLAALDHAVLTLADQIAG